MYTKLLLCGINVLKDFSVSVTYINSIPQVRRLCSKKLKVLLCLGRNDNYNKFIRRFSPS